MNAYIFRHYTAVQPLFLRLNMSASMSAAARLRGTRLTATHISRCCATQMLCSRSLDMQYLKYRAESLLEHSRAILACTDKADVSPAFTMHDLPHQPGIIPNSHPRDSLQRIRSSARTSVVQPTPRRSCMCTSSTERVFLPARQRQANVDDQSTYSSTR